MKTSSNSTFMRHQLTAILVVTIFISLGLVFDSVLRPEPVYAMSPPPGSADSWSDVVDSGQDTDPSNDYALNPLYVIGIGSSEADYVYTGYDYYVETTVTAPDGSSASLESI